MATQALKSNRSSPPILPNELIIDILSLLRVKHLMQMKCVSKSWNTLISDPMLIKMHLNLSSLNPQFSLIAANNNDHSFVPFPNSLLWENCMIHIPDDPYYQLNNHNCNDIVGSCNGLVCLVGHSFNEITKCKKFWLRFWNPATRTISDELGTSSYEFIYSKFSFGYDNSTETYKVVVLGSTLYHLETNVKVFSLGDNVWRNIHDFAAIPLQMEESGHQHDGVHLSCTINWMAFQGVFDRDDDDDDIVDEFVIISLDLSTETLTHMMPPENYDNVGIGYGLPNISVLMDSLCFSYDKETEFFIWQMTKFGDDKSWSLFLKFSYHNVGIDYELGHPRIELTPLHLYEDGDTLLLANEKQDSAILYNWRNNIAKKTIINNKICWFSIRDYVESLVPLC